MRGTLLSFDYAEREGYISGDDGERYRFDPEAWKSKHDPSPGIAVDFEIEGNRAKAIFATKNRPVVATERNDKEKIAAGLLALFLGGLGIHKFYLGQNGAGIVMLLCSLFGIILLFIPTLIVGIIAFIEAIIYLVTPDDEFQRKYVDEGRAWF